MTTSNSPPTATTIGKRSRPLTPRRSSTTSSNASNLSSSSASSPETKIARSSRSPDTSSTSIEGSETNRPILCTLPPTCNRHHITLANSKELERHYATYHAHVCEEPGCGCVFPEAKLLELHQTECHDSLAALRKERGEKIFGCMSATCTRYFQSPKARRLHMIEAHKYPKEFFFAVTNKGIGGLLKRWGEGASMIRGEWKPRTKVKEKAGEVDRMVVEEDEDSSSEEDEEAVEEVDMDELERTPRPGARPLHPASPPKTSDVDALAEGMSSLTLIPSSIRFGRGGRGGGLGIKGRGRGGRGGVVPPQVINSNSGGHQRSTSTSSITETKQLQGASGAPGGGNARGRGGKKGKGHRTSASIGMEMDVSAGEGGDVVLLPPAGASGAERSRGSGRAI
ncbi:hypothetical protein NP233_g5207 [Leucocoprinus birnbaumii]|uniref:C2H2-type domain-containing protein n=1 Tax=Leucocoprinus birnbaumii TaxID=56174 RepID=A0AAD5YWY1_9AGAR|nr:hypothetical protein NP233_g5207 [Leucocoprinus birnbaumii]